MVSEWKRARSLALVVITLIISAAVPGVRAEAEHSGAAAERAAREILDARDRANEAAQAMFDAESRLDALTIELASSERALVLLEAEVGELKVGLTESAVRQYIGAGQNSLMLFQDTTRGNDQEAALVYAGVVTGSQLVRSDDYEEAIDELDDARQALDRQRNDTIAARETWSGLKAEAENQVLELQRIEQERLDDAQVQHELERQRQVRADQERREREQEEAAQRQAAVAAELEASSREPSSENRIDDSTPSGGSDNGSPAPPTTVSVPAPAAAAPRPAAATPPPAPAPAEPAPAAPTNAGAGMACPVAGPRSFADTWGAPRSGGRRHEGVDMMAPGGTQLVAAESGSATFKTNKLGGNAVWITGSSGTKYYYAHLSAWEGSSRNVSQGEVIGYVGSTGNTSVNHLHFEVHPNGGLAVNPYPYVRSAC